MKSMIRYTVIHEHRYGQTIHHFLSKSIPVDLMESQCERLAEKLKIDYNHDTDSLILLSDDESEYVTLSDDDMAYILVGGIFTN